MLRYIGKVNGSFTATSGTIACGNALKAYMQPVLDGNSTYTIAVKATQSASGTASKANCGAVVANRDTYEAIRPAGAPGNWYIAYQVYNGTTATAGSSTDIYAVEKMG